MQITSNPNSLQVYQQQSEKVAAQNTEQAAEAKAKAPEAKSDSVVVSQDAKLLAEAHATATSSPDVRADKVAALREQVQNGTYQVDNTRVAEGILRDDMAIFG